LCLQHSGNNVSRGGRGGQQGHRRCERDANHSSADSRQIEPVCVFNVRAASEIAGEIGGMPPKNRDSPMIDFAQARNQLCRL
jgi:hypothetical protein